MITVETVAEVLAVEPEAVSVEYHPAEEDRPFGTVQLTFRRWGDLQFISFPADKAPAVARAILDVIP